MYLWTYSETQPCIWLNVFVFEFVFERFLGAVFVFVFVFERFQQVVFVFVFERFQQAVFVFVFEKISEGVFVFVFVFGKTYLDPTLHSTHFLIP